jgi:hypothetical protein
MGNSISISRQNPSLLKVDILAKDKKVEKMK